MENLVAANSLLNMDCADTLSLDQHYCKLMHAPVIAPIMQAPSSQGDVFLNSPSNHPPPPPPPSPACIAIWLWADIFRHGDHEAVLFHYVCLCPLAAQDFLPSLGDIITTPVTQVTVSADGVVGAVDEPQWKSLHSKRPVAQLQSRKRGENLFRLFWEQTLFFSFNVLIVFFLFFFAGQKFKHRRAESPTPEITVKKDKYNKGTVSYNKLETSVSYQIICD